MSAKRLFAVLLTMGIMIATIATVATVTMGPTYADPKGNPCSGAH